MFSKLSLFGRKSSNGKRRLQEQRRRRQLLLESLESRMLLTATIESMTPDNGPLANDFISNSGSFALHGAATPFHFVDIQHDGVSVGAAVSGSTGRWTFADSAVAGTYSYVAVDQADMGASVPQPVVIDMTSPTVVSLSRSNPTNPWTNADSLSFQMTFSEKVAGLAASNFSLFSGPDASTTAGIGKPTTSDGGTTWNITVSGGDLATYNGYVELYSNPLSSWNVSDLAGNAFGGWQGAAEYAVDHVAPTLAWGTGTPAPNAAGWNKTDVTLSYTTSDPDPTGLGSASGVATQNPASPLVFATEGASRTQQVTVTDVAGNVATFTSPVVNLDKTTPHLLSLDRASPSAERTNADSVTFAAAFSEPVFGLQVGNFSLATTSTAGIAAVNTADGGQTWTVTVTGGDLADFNGPLGLYLLNNTGVNDIADNPLAETSWTGPIYTIDNLAPTVDSVTVSTATQAADPLLTDTDHGGTLTVQVHFSDAMLVDGTANPAITFDPPVGDSLTLVPGSAAWSDSPVGPNDTFTMQYTIADKDCDSRHIQIGVAGAQDVAGNAQASYTPAAAFSIDTQNPTVTSVDVPAAKTYKLNDRLEFTVHFSEPMFNSPQAPRFALTVGAVAKYASLTSGNGTPDLVFEYTVAAGDLDTDGIAVTGAAIDLNGVHVRDAAGNDAALTLHNFASTSGVDVDGVRPTVVSVTANPPLVTDATAANFGFEASTLDGWNTSSWVSISNTQAHSGAYSALVGSPAHVGYTAELSRTITLPNANPMLRFYYKPYTSDGIIWDQQYAHVRNTSGSVLATVLLTCSNSQTWTAVQADLSAWAGQTVVLVFGNHDDWANDPTYIYVDDITVSGLDSSVPGFSAAVQFNEPMDISVAPTLTLNPDVSSGGTPTLSNPLGSWSADARTYTVTYTVADQNVELTGITVAVAGGKDVAGNAQDAYAPAAALSIDTKNPLVTSVDVPAAQTYKLGDVLDFTVHLDESVAVGGTPRLALTLGSGTVFADYTSGGGTNALSFQYTVTSGDLDSDGVAVAGLQANGGSLRDAVGNDADLTLNNVHPATLVKVDGVRPAVTSVDVPAARTYVIGDNMDFTVHFTEAVYDTAVGPQIQLMLDTGTVAASLVSGAGTSALVFRYTVSEGVLDTDGSVLLGTAIALNGATLRDAAGNDAVLSLPGVGGTSGVHVDGVRPAVTSVTATPSFLTDATLGTGVFTVTVVFGESMNRAAPPTLSFLPNVSGGGQPTLSNPSPVGWTHTTYDNDTYTVAYDVADQDLVSENITLGVTDAADAAGNTQAAYTPQAALSIYTLLPTVYVNASWAGTSLGADPDGPAGPAAHFGVDAFASIQGGVNAVDVGGTVYVAAGNYAESVLVDQSVTIRGAGSDARGTVVQVPALVLPAVGVGFTITADDVTLQDLLVQGDSLTAPGNLATTNGVVFNTTVEGVTLKNLVASLNNSGVLVDMTGAVTDLTLEQVSLNANGDGFYVAAMGTVEGLTVTGSHFDGNLYGFAATADSSSSSNQDSFTGLSVDSSTFTNNLRKGIYLEKLNDAVFDNITVDHSGTSGAYPDGAGIDINLKFGDYAEIQLLNSTISDSGTGSPINGVGLTIKARDFGGAGGIYETNPATLTDVTVANNFILGNQTGIRFGEPGQNNVGPTNVQVYENSITGNLLAGLDVQSLGVVEASGNWWGSANGPDTALNTWHGVPKGDQVLGTAIIVPWLTDGTDSQPTVAGFQPGPLDTTPPAITAALTSDTGLPADGITSQANIQGTVTDVNAIWLQAALDSSAYADVAIGPDGNFTVDPAALPGGTGLPDGPHTVHLQALDGAGNPSGVTDLTFALDTATPTASVTMAPSMINVASGGSATTTLTITYADTGSGLNPATFGTSNVTVDNGATVTGFSAVGNAVTYTLTANRATWAASAQGAYTVSLVVDQVQDVAGNPVAANAALSTFLVDTVAPTASVTTAPPTINVASGGAATTTLTVTYADTVSGIDTQTFGTSNLTVDNGATVSGFSATGNAVTYTITACGGANWSASTQGMYTVSLLANQVKDLAGNVVAAKASLSTFVVDTVAPTLAPVDMADGASGRTVGAGVSQTYTVAFSEAIDPATISAGNFSNAGTAAITIGTVTQLPLGVFSVQVTPTSSGTLQLRVTPTSGPKTISDVAANPLAATVLDDTTLIVVQPAIIAITPDTGIPGDFITSNNGFCSLRGTDWTFGTVEVFLDSGAGFVSQGTAGAGSGVGNWTFPLTLTNGTYTVQVRDVGTGGLSAAQSLTIDTVAPAAPVVALAQDTGSSPTDRITRIGTLTVTAEPGATLEYSINSGATWTASFTAVEGANTVEVRRTDVAGNVSPVTTFSFTLDTVAPTLNAGISNPDGATGWYNIASGPAVLTYVASDAGGSGVTTPAPFTFSDGNQLCHAGIAVTDVAGNASATTAAFTGINQDRAAPTINAQRDTAANANGWNNANVASSYTASDNGPAGLASPATGSFTFTTEGAGQSHSFTVTDLAGNSASATINSVNIDRQAPTINAQRDTAANANGWNNTNVASSYTASDNGPAGLAGPATGSFTFTTEGAGQSHTFTVTDLAGNSASATINSVNIDRQAPTINAQRDTAANANGWNNANVASSYTASDNGPAGLAGPATGSFAFTAEGAGQSHTFTVTDLAGNSASATINSVNIDRQAPTITALRDTAANANGWNNTNVASRYTASDNGPAGLAGPASGSFAFTAEGAGQSHTFTVIDLAGNSASATINSVNIDQQAPTITAFRDTAANANGWNNTNVASRYTASDIGPAGLAGPATGSFTFTAEGAGQSHTFTVADLAGNSASATISGVNIDQQAPTINAQRDTLPNANGWNGTAVAISYTASDNGPSGLVDPAAGTYTFTTAGAAQSHTFKVADRAGNSASATIGNVNIDLTPPLLLEGHAAAPQNGTLDLLPGLRVSFFDPDDAEPQTFRLVSVPSHGKLYLNGAEVPGAPVEVPAALVATLNYVPDKNYLGPDNFQWNVADRAQHAAAAATVNITVVPVTRPTVISFVRQVPAAAMTNASSVTFRATFSEDVVNVDTSDFAWSGTAAGDRTVASVHAVSASVYDVTVKGLTGSNGTVNLDLAANPTIDNLLAIALRDVAPTGADETYTIDHLAPRGLSVLRQNPTTTAPHAMTVAYAATATQATTVTFRVTFSEDVQNLDLSDLAFAGAAGVYATASDLTPVTGSSVFDLTVNVPLYAQGLLTLELAPGATIDDLAGNALGDGTPPDPYESYTIDHTTTPVYVNDAWRDTLLGAAPAGQPTLIFGYNAFAHFPDALGRVARPGTVNLSMTGTAESETLNFVSVASGDPAVHRLGWDTSLCDVFSDVLVNLSVDGAGGADTATLTDATGGVVATLSPAGGTITGLGYAITLQNVEAIQVIVQSGGRANLYDSAGADQFQAGPQWANLRGTGFFNQASGFDAVYAYGTAGDAATDTAYLYDSAGADQFQAGPQWAYLRGSGFLNQASGFDSVYAYGTAGDAATDTAYLYDSAGADQFQAGPQWAYLRGSGFLNQASGFDSVYAYGTAGDAATDTAYLYDSAGVDQFQAGPQWAFLRGSGFFNQASDFDSVYAYGTAGDAATDTAYLYDSAGADQFQAGPQWAYLRGSGFLNVATSFDAVCAYGTASDVAVDTAYLYGSTGADEFDAGPLRSFLRGSGFDNSASSFDAVYAYGTAGDTAYLHGSAGADEFDAGPQWSFLRGGGFYNNASGFNTVYAYGATGDTAFLHGSAGADEFQAGPQWSFLRGGGFYDNASGFDAVYAYGAAGDTAYLHGSPGADEFQAGPQWSFLRGGGFYDNASGFDAVYAYGAAGDTAYLHGSPGADEFQAGPQWSFLRSSGNCNYYNNASGFDAVYAYAQAGTGTVDTAYLYDSTGADEFQAGPQWSFLRGRGFSNNAAGFDVVRASAAKNDGDVANLYDSAGSDALVGQSDWFASTRITDRVFGQGFKVVNAESSRGGVDTLDLEPGLVDYLFQATGDWRAV